jgi:hypothetical protein
MLISPQYGDTPRGLLADLALRQPRITPSSFGDEDGAARAEGANWLQRGSAVRRLSTPRTKGPRLRSARRPSRRGGSVRGECRGSVARTDLLPCPQCRGAQPSRPRTWTQAPAVLQYEAPRTHGSSTRGKRALGMTSIPSKMVASMDLVRLHHCIRTRLSCQCRRARQMMLWTASQKLYRT